MLFINTSKIQFESKSQQDATSIERWNSCLSIRQRYNLKANHNEDKSNTIKSAVVYQYVKDTI